MNRDFFFGSLIYFLFSATLQDFRGLEGHIAHLREHWIPVPFPLTLTLFLLVTAYYIASSIKRRK